MYSFTYNFNFIFYVVHKMENKIQEKICNSMQLEKKLLTVLFIVSVLNFMLYKERKEINPYFNATVKK